MNYMPKVLEILGVEVGELFNIYGSAMNPHMFDEEFNLIDKEYYTKNERIRTILNGTTTIEKLPWKPKEDDIYYFVTEGGYVNSSQFFLRTFDYNNYNSGNYFETTEEITDEIKQRILQEMKGKYEND